MTDIKFREKIGGTYNYSSSEKDLASWFRKTKPKIENLEQCTGIKDRNGKDIYEGDIIKAKVTSWDLGELFDLCEVYYEVRKSDGHMNEQVCAGFWTKWIKSKVIRGDMVASIGRFNEQCFYKVEVVETV